MKNECCFCGEDYGKYGHNPEPLKRDGKNRCCDDCNRTKVIPERLKRVDW